jgi:hypothetical protein
MREALTRDEVKKLLGKLAPELDQVEKLTSKSAPTISMVTPDDETIWVIRRGAVFYYERHLP